MNNIQTISKAVRQTSHHRLGILVATVVVFLLLAYWLLVMPSPVIIFMLVIAAAIGFLIVLRPYVGFLLMVASLGFEAITPGVPVTIFRILGLWTFCAWLLRKLLAGELPLVIAPQNVCIVTFILTALASAFSALQFDISLVQIATLIQLSVLYFFVTGIVDSEQRLKHVAWTWVVGGTAASLYSIAALISQDMERAVGGIGDPNYLVLYLTIPIALSLFLFQAERSSILRTFLGFSLLTFLVVTILSFSRGGFISLIVILVLSLLKSRDKINNGDTGRFIRNGENGILLEYEELPKLPEVIKELLANEDLRNRLGANARKFAEENFWSWQERIEAEVTEVSKLIEQREKRDHGDE